MRRKILSMLLAVAFTVCCFSSFGYAAKNSDVTRVYKKVVTNTDFISKLRATVPLYNELGLTEETLNITVKQLISEVIDQAIKEKEAGILTTQNIEQRFKEILMNSVLSMESSYLSLILDSFPEETIAKMMDGVIPEEFRELYSLLAQEAYCILGYSERKTDIIFDDMAGYEWAFTAVDFLFNLDIINGTGDFVFEPQKSVTREQFVKMMCTAFDFQVGEIFPIFSDVPESAWYHPYVMKMASAGIIKGISETEFGTGSNIRRQDMAVLMHRMGEELGYFSSEELKFPFNDQNEISSYALTAVNTLRNNEILKGDEKGNFNPEAGATRAEAAQMIYNLYIHVSSLNS